MNQMMSWQCTARFRRPGFETWLALALTLCFCKGAAGQAPTVTSINPASGIQGTNSSYSLSGSNFITGATVNVANPGISVGSVFVSSSSQISVTFSISGTAATGPTSVTVTTSSGTSNSVTFTVMPKPTLTSITPNTVMNGIPFDLTVRGTDFFPGVVLYCFCPPSDGTLGGTQFVSSTELRVTGNVSGVSSGTWGVALKYQAVPTSAYSNSIPVTFSNTPVPTLTSMNPASGAQGTSVPVTLTGTGFTPIATINVSNGITPSNVVFVNSTQITATFNIGGSAASGLVSVTTSGGTSNTQQFTVTTTTLSSLACNPTSLGPGGFTSCTITLSGPAPSGGAAVGLSSNNSPLLVPNSVTVAAGSSTANFTATAGMFSVSSTAILTGTYNNTSRTATVQLVPPPTLTSLTCNPTSLGSGQTTVCTVTLSGPAPGGGAAVGLSNNNTLLSAPVSVTVAAGSTTASFAATVGTLSASSTAILTGTYNNTSQTATIQLVATPTLTGLTCNPSSLGSGQSTLCTATLSGAAPSNGAAVGLSSNNTLLSVQGSVTVPAGSSSVNLTATAGALTASSTAILTGTYNNTSQTATIQLLATPTLTGLTCNPSSLGSGQSTLCTATLSAAAPSGGAAVVLGSNNSQLSVQGLVTVAAGSSAANFTATAGALTASSTAILTGTYNNTSQTATIQLAGIPTLTNLTCNPTSLGSGQSTLCTVTLSSAAPSSGAAVGLSSNNSQLSVQGSVTVPANSFSASFTAIAGALTVSSTAILTGTYNNTSQTATIQLVATSTLTNLTCNPTSLGSGQSTLCTVTLSSAAPSSGAAVGLSSNNSQLSVQGSVTVPAGSSSANFAATAGAVSANVTVTINASYNGVSRSVPISLVALPIVNTTLLPNGTVATAYSATLAAGNGSPPYNTWAVVTGALPSGLNLDPGNGAISGIPLAPGTFRFSVTVKDSAGAVSPSQSLSIVIVPRVSITTSSLPGATVGTAYSAQLTAADGVPPYSGWTVSTGTLPAGLTLNAASGLISGTPTSATGSPVSISVTVRDSAGGTSLPQNLSISLGAPPALTTAPASLSFSYRLGDPAPAPQSISIFSGGAFSVAVTSDQNFLIATPASGQTPATITVSINTAVLRAGATLGGRVVIAPVGSPSSSVTVPVTLNVEAPPLPQLQIAPTQFSINAVQGASATRLQLAVLNVGGGTLNFTAQLRFLSGANWASLDSNSGTAFFGSPGSVGITINSAALNPGVYEAQVAILDQGSNQAQTCRILISVTARALSIQLSQSGLRFTAAAAGAASPAQTFGIANAGQGPMNWSASAQTLSGPGGWLVVTPAAGVSTAGQASTPVATVSINPAQLSSGQYFGSVRVVAPNAANSPQIVSVVVNVVEPVQAPAPVLSDTGVLLVGDTAAPTASTREISIANLSGKALAYVSTSSTEDGANWVSFSPPTGTLAPGPNSIRVQGNFTGLAPGVRRGTLRLSFADGNVETVGAVSVLPSIDATGAGKNLPRAAGTCKPGGLVPVFLSLATGFTVIGSNPVSLRVLAVDDCGAPLVNGGVFVRFSNASNFILLSHIGNGNWSGTWVPGNADAVVGIRATAYNEGGLGGDTPILRGTVRSTTSALARPTGIFNSASFKAGDQVTIGNWASLVGEGMADGNLLAPATPFGPSLLTTSVRLGDVPMPVNYVDPSQVNVMIPRGLTPNTQHQIIVQRGATLSVPIQVTVADIQPAIYTLNAQGEGQGWIVIAETGTIAGPTGSADGARPARRNEAVSIICAGLGPVSSDPADGEPAPLDTLINTLAMPSVTIGGVNAPVSFAGLAPGMVGAYRVDVTVPAESGVGDALPVVITLNEIASNVATMAIE